MSEIMPGAGPETRLAPLPYTLFKTHHVVMGHTHLHCDRQALKRHPMVIFIEGPRPLEEGARAARGGTKHVLGRSVLIAFEKRAGHAGSEDVVALRRALFVRTFASVSKVRDGHECGTC